MSSEKRRAGRKLGVYAAVLVALVGAGAAYSAASPSAKLQKQDRLYGGGQFGPGCFSNSSTCFAEPRNLSVDAHAEGNGNGATGNLNYGAPGGVPRPRTVTCLRVDGSRAAIGGLVLDGSGFGYVQLFVDRGTVTSGPRDLASPSYVDTVENLAAVLPGFPSTCPPAGGNSDVPASYRELEWGDIVVQDAPDE